MTGDDDAGEPLSERSLGLRTAVVEAEHHASDSGWDQPARLFGLVPTAELAVAEPELAAELGVNTGTANVFTPVEQDLEEESGTLEELLGRIMWPESVAGALVVVERVVLPPEAEADVPGDPTLASSFAAEHKDREDVRLSVGALRSGEAHCVLRMRSHDDDNSLLHGADVVPGLVAALRETLDL
ncbi:MAG: PPA1309 family protein [Nocardioidaceae bacterium]